MQEYSVEPDNQRSYVLCRLKKKPNDKANSTPHSGEGEPSYNIVSEVENHETPAAFPQAHGHEEVTQKLIASGEQEESSEEIMNRLMADPDSQFYGETRYHQYVIFQSASSPRQRSGDDLLSSDMNTEVVIQHGHEEVTKKFIASGEQEESSEEIMNRLMADPDSQFYGETRYHQYVIFQSASSPRQRSGDDLLGSDMNTEGVIQQDSFQAQGDEEVIQGLRSQPLYSPVREEMGYHPSFALIGQSASSATPHSGYDRAEVKFRVFLKSATTTAEPQWNLSLANNLDLDAEEHLEYGTAGRTRLQGATQELQASFSSTEKPPNEVGEEADRRNSISPSEYCFIVLFLIMILFTAFTLLVYVAWKLVRDLSRKRKPFVVLCCAVSCYFLFFRNTSGVSHQHTVVSNPAARMLPE